MNVYVIGCGGIGGYVLEKLPMVIASLSLDLLEGAGQDISQYLEGAGNIVLPNIVSSLVLIDGDVFNARNSLRQGEGAGRKLVRHMLAIKRKIEELKEASSMFGEALTSLRKLTDAIEADKDLAEARARLVLNDDDHLTAEMVKRIESSVVKATFLQNMRLIGYNEYVTPKNITEIIPPLQKAPKDFPEKCKTQRIQLLLTVPVVFMCVDNLKTRYEVSKYMENFDNCLVINGGNSKTKGHVTLYERENGVAYDPPIYEIYPEVRPDADKRPDEMGCDEVAPAHDQIAVTNSIIADAMLARFVTWARGGLTKTIRGSTVRYNEILIDIEKPSMMPVHHPVTKEETT